MDGAPMVLQLVIAGGILWAAFFFFVFIPYTVIAGAISKVLEKHRSAARTAPHSRD